MKLFIASDIHGDLDRTKELIKKFKLSNADNLIILGDICSGYSYCQDKDMMELLESVSPRLVLLKGNCDTNMDLDITSVKMYDEYIVQMDNRRIYFNHGHQGICNIKFNKKDIYCHGHTHISNISVGDIIRCCPGSIVFPRGGGIASYMIIDDSGIYIYSLQDKIIMKYFFEVENEK